MTKGGQTVLRKFDGSTIHDLITDNVMLQSFAVAPNGTVVVTGSTTSTGAYWTRRISPSGSVMTLTNQTATFLSAFPDGNVYFGRYGGVARYDTAADQLDPKFWIADRMQQGGYYISDGNGGEIPAGGNQYNDTGSVCSEATPSETSFCNQAGSSITWQYASPNGHEYVVSGGTSYGNTLAAYYPTIKLFPSEVTTIGVAAGVGDQVALAGTNSNGQNVLTLLDPATGAEKELNGPGNEIEVYHLSYAGHRNELLFDGLRFADDKYVVGKYNLSTGQLKISATISGKLTDLQSF
jgi:hypothetical protein